MKQEIEDKMNLTLLADFYEITMANGYLESGIRSSKKLSSKISQPPSRIRTDACLREAPLSK